MLFWLIIAAAAGLALGWLSAHYRRAGWAQDQAGQLCAARAMEGELRAQLEKTAAAERELRQRLEQEQDGRARAEAARQEAEKNLLEQKKGLEENAAKLKEAFQSLAAEALKSNNRAFLDLAASTLEARQKAIEGLVQPLSRSLENYGQLFGKLDAQLLQLQSSEKELRRETATLSGALRRPEVRGRWGETALRRVVELAGLNEHCDFTEQTSVATEEGRLRPDMIIHLPARRQVVVDSKANLQHYLEALETADPERRQALFARHAEELKKRLRELSLKAYWEQFPEAPDFVVMFIPGEAFLDKALELEPGLLEEGWQNRVIPCTPTNLIALLKTVALGWRQEEIAKSAQLVCDLGKELYARLRTLAGHIGGVGGALENAGKAYNEAVGSLERMVLPAARRFRDLGAGEGKEIAPLEPVEIHPRPLVAADFKNGDGSA